MNLEWISIKGTSLIAYIVALGFAVIAVFDVRYRYFYICIAAIAFIYGCRQFKRRDTPFEKRERELRRKTM